MQGKTVNQQQLMVDFEDQNSWIGKGTANVLSNSYTITFVMGKGAGLVPEVVTKDCERALQLLINANNRSAICVGCVSPTNNILFAHRKDSKVNSTLHAPQSQFVL